VIIADGPSSSLSTGLTTYVAVVDPDEKTSGSSGRWKPKRVAAAHVEKQANSKVAASFTPYLPELAQLFGSDDA